MRIDHLIYAAPDLAMAVADVEERFGAPAGLILESVQLGHPEPQSVASMLAALGAHVAVKAATTPALVARLGGPNGSMMLR